MTPQNTSYSPLDQNFLQEKAETTPGYIGKLVSDYFKTERPLFFAEKLTIIKILSWQKIHTNLENIKSQLEKENNPSQRYFLQKEQADLQKNKKDTEISLKSTQKSLKKTNDEYTEKLKSLLRKTLQNIATSNYVLSQKEQDEDSLRQKHYTAVTEALQQYMKKGADSETKSTLNPLHQKMEETLYTLQSDNTLTKKDISAVCREIQKIINQTILKDMKERRENQPLTTENFKAIENIQEKNFRKALLRALQKVKYIEHLDRTGWPTKETKEKDHEKKQKSFITKENTR